MHRIFVFKLLSSLYRIDMGLSLIVPVQVAFQIDLVANLQTANSLVSIGAQTAQVRLYNHGVGLIANSNLGGSSENEQLVACVVRNVEGDVAVLITPSLINAGDSALNNY